MQMLSTMEHTELDFISDVSEMQVQPIKKEVKYIGNYDAAKNVDLLKELIRRRIEDKTTVEQVLLHISTIFHDVSEEYYNIYLNETAIPI